MNRSIAKITKMGLAIAAIASSISWGQTTLNCSNGQSQKMGSGAGYDYELWSQDGAGNATMTLNPSTENGGAFSVEWRGTVNMLARSGKRWGSNSTVTVQNVGNITSEFEVEWSSSDNVKYVSVYGWGYYDKGDNPSGFTDEIEYYIIQDRGSYNPTSNGGKKKGSAVIDGINYDFYTTERHNQPSLSGTSTFMQYWSIPSNTSQHRTKGTISISKHFSEWAKVGMKMGRLYEVASMKIESYTGQGGNAQGHATVKKNILKIGGSADELGLNVTASPAAAGTVTKSPSANYYAPKTAVQLTAKANEGWKFVGWEGDVTGSTETISVTMDKEKSVVAKFELVGETTVNLLKDGDFPSSSVISTSQDASWFLGQGSNWGNSAAKTSVSGGTATVDVTTIGAETYQPQLVQYNLALDKGMTYKLTFKASADVDRKIEVNFQQSVDPWGSYATKEFDITTTEKEYSFIFTMEEASDDAAQFAFNLGQATGSVKFSDVKLVFTTAKPGSENGPGDDTTTVIAQQLRMDYAQTVSVFDMQGKFMGKVELSAGASLKDAVAAKFQKSGIYMVKGAMGIQKVRVVNR
ncbi:glycoside hydrolase family 11 protein [uncultured Fibrobacter sp.]|uniref:glycoside hydrolase family 11 protein n=1 Tax=uncultured Fibrobacter sp. TaxID=261512 RepID=UPI0025ECFC97|nr:glycoside hydrolase family 11 protein [uncultured Fibrobacter sp.]